MEPGGYINEHFGRANANPAGSPARRGRAASPGGWRTVSISSDRCATTQSYYSASVEETLRCVEPARGLASAAIVGAANRDPADFDAPGEFRLDRTDGKGDISFGKGAHFCVGAAPAPLEAQIVLGQLLIAPLLSRQPMSEVVAVHPGTPPGAS
jgi:hypothetical protein